MDAALTAKQKALQHIQKMDDDATFDDILYELYLLYKVERGLLEARSMHTVSHEDVKRELFERYQVGPPPPDEAQ